MYFQWGLERVCEMGGVWNDYNNMHFQKLTQISCNITNEVRLKKLRHCMV